MSIVLTANHTQTLLDIFLKSIISLLSHWNKQFWLHIHQLEFFLSLSLANKINQSILFHWKPLCCLVLKVRHRVSPLLYKIIETNPESGHLRYRWQLDSQVLRLLEKLFSLSFARKLGQTFLRWFKRLRIFFLNALLLSNYSR